MKTYFRLKCVKCEKYFEKELAIHYVKESRFKPLCSSCTKEKVRDGILRKINKIKENLPYEKRNTNDRKQIKWNQQGKKCNKCNYNLYDYLSGPYNLHHIDGNPNNKNIDNEELLCCNCHFMTDNYGFKKRKHTNETKTLLKKRTFVGANIFNKQERGY